MTKISKFVIKSEYPPNTHEIRYIDDFWGLIKGELYKDGWEAKKLDKLRDKIIFCFKKVNRECVHKSRESTHRRIDTIRRYGIVEMR